MEALRPFGYYIADIVKKPDFCTLPCSLLLSVSPCMSNQHPELSCCYFENDPKERQEYQQRLGMDDAQFSRLCSEVTRLFDDEALDIDGRFLSLSDAVQFYECHISGRIDARVVCIACTEECMRTLSDEGGFHLSIGGIADTVPENAQPLGCEILGADFGSFHSWLCNGLERNIAQSFPLRVSEYGLILNPFEEAMGFAESIQGKGEPITWLPCMLYDCTPAL
ncbi:MAG: hypothetical protein E7559_03425 [Ruminococcaceae bacterium]|nr:hypothetical protein [Oscillospiraceae bacterium]